MSSHRVLALATALCFTLCGGCGSEDEASEPAPLPPLEITEGCNPLAADIDCLLPYPSNHFLVPDSSLPNQVRIELGPAAELPASTGAFDPNQLHPADGFSHGTQILALFPQGVDPANLVFHTGDLNTSLSAESPTLLINAETGERVLHFAELDPRATSDARRALLIRPVERLSNSTRYIVAIRRLRDLEGELIEAPEGFARIRDGLTRGDPVLAPLAARYEADLFPLLSAGGIERSELQLAWDFSTRSEENATRDMLAVRSDVLSQIASAPPSVSVVSVSDDVSADVFRVIEGTVSVPLYIDPVDPPATKLVRDAQGSVIQKGSVDVPFTVLIPRSVAERAAGAPAGRLLQFGHGFFGTRHEIENGFMPEFANQHGFVVVAADWWGLSEVDRVAIVDQILNDPGKVMLLTDRIHQAMANFLTLAAAAQGPIANLSELHINGQPSYDPTRLYFYGISMGHILGGTYLALSPTIERAALSVGGADLSFLMFRSRPIGPILFFIEQILPDKLDVQKLAMMLQTSFDRVDPLSYAPHVIADPYPMSPSERRLLMQIGIGDAAVPNLAAHLHARALGLGTLDPAPRVIAGIPGSAAPLDAGLVEFDFKIDPPVGVEATPPETDTPVHGAVRELAAGQLQVDRFLMPNGKIEATCSGVCDPE